MEASIQAGLAGIHPRAEAHVQASRDADRGRADARALADARRADAQALVDLQAQAGVAFVSDGLLGWQDLFRPFAERTPGLRVGPLTRWFDNNTFYRRPIVERAVQHPEPVAPSFDAGAKLPKGTQGKAILPGPYTFARLADDRAYGSVEKLLTALARDVLAPEVRDLAQRGVGWVQFSEPALLKERPQPEEWEALQRGYLAILDGVRITSCVHAGFGDASRQLQELFDLPVDYIGLDFTETPLDAFEDFQPTRGLQAGLADARSSIVESAEELAAAAQDLLDLAEPPALALAPSAELEYLPRAVADAKGQALGAAAKLLGGQP